MKRIYLLTILLPLTVVMLQTNQVLAWDYNNNRIACSADGNNQADNHPEAKWPRADPDDWAATPAALAIIAKLGLQGKLVHYSYNNFIESPPHTTDKNQMEISTSGSISRWGFNSDIFFDVTLKLDTARKHLKNEIAKSTAQDPLYYIHMGPSEFFYQVVEEAVNDGVADAFKYVYIVSHSGYNDDHKRRNSHHTMKQAQSKAGNRMNYKRIKDQNDAGNANNLWNAGSTFSVYHWIRDHKDKTIPFIYERMEAHPGNKADISDCGMIYWLLTGDENGSPSKFKDFIGGGISPTTIQSPYHKSGNPLPCDISLVNGDKEIFIDFAHVQNEQITFSIIDLLGKVHIRQSVNAMADGTFQTVNIESIPASMYIVHITRGNKTITKKLLKSKTL